MMSPPLISKTKKDLHLTRKIWHAAWGVIYSLLFFFILSKTIFLIFLAVNITCYLTIELIRIYRPTLHRKLIKNWKWFLRESEMNGVNTGLYFNLSCFIAVAFFPKTIAVLSILYLGLADPLAAFVGTMWGKKSIQLFPGKSLVGNIAAFLTCFLITLLFLKNSISFNPLMTISLIGGFAGMLGESLPLKIDDNLTLPIISGLILWGAAFLLKIPIL